MRIIQNNNNKIISKIREGLKNNDGYCPCALFKNENTKCMCKDFREQKIEGLCHCGLYKKVK